MENITANPNTALYDVIGMAVQIPAVKVGRESFLRDKFNKHTPEEIENIIELGPVDAKVDRRELQNIAYSLTMESTMYSSGASFVAGLPGGLAMFATIPADVIQFYCIALRLAQELAYLYGEKELWSRDGSTDKEVIDQLILYCGVMLGVSGASQSVKIMSSALAKQALKKLPQKALTKTFYYPIVKSVAKTFGARMTKGIFAKGVSKAVPILGGVVSGAMTWATMRPMGMRLTDTLDKAHFSYTEAEIVDDLSEVIVEAEKELKEESATEAVRENNEAVQENNEAVQTSDKEIAISEKIYSAKKLLDDGIISGEEFARIKARLIERI